MCTSHTSHDGVLNIRRRDGGTMSKSHGLDWKAKSSNQTDLQLSWDASSKRSVWMLHSLSIPTRIRYYVFFFFSNFWVKLLRPIRWTVRIVRKKLIIIIEKIHPFPNKPTPESNPDSQAIRDPLQAQANKEKSANMRWRERDLIWLTELQSNDGERREKRWRWDPLRLSTSPAIWASRAAPRRTRSPSAFPYTSSPRTRSSNAASPLRRSPIEPPKEEPRRTTNSSKTLTLQPSSALSPPFFQLSHKSFFLKKKIPKPKQKSTPKESMIQVSKINQLWSQEIGKRWNGFPLLRSHSTIFINFSKSVT